MIQIRSVYVVGIDIWQVENANIPFAVARVERGKDETLDLANPWHIMIATGKIMGGGKLISFLGGDSLMSSHMLWESEPLVPSFWTDKVIAAYIDSSYNVDYLVWKAFIKLSPETVSQLASLQPIESQRRFSELLGAVFPRCTGEHVNFNKYDPSHSFILYIEPETAYSDNYVNINDYATDIVALLGMAGHAPQPHLLVDVVLAHSIGTDPPSRAITAVGLEPLKFKQEVGSVLLPKTVLDLAAYYAYAIELRHLSERLRALPFYREPFHDYLMGLGKLGTNDSLLSSYQSKFLVDREWEISELLRAAQTIEEIQRAMQDNYVSKYGSSEMSKRIDTGARVNGWSYDIFATLVRIVPEAERDIRDVMDLIHQRVDALSNFLRDASVTAAAKANVLLQRWILIFTIVVTAVVITTLIITWPGVP